MTELLTIDEVSEVLRVPVNTLRSWRQRGLGPAGFRQGKRVFFTRDAVEEYVRKVSSSAA